MSKAELLLALRKTPCVVSAEGGAEAVLGYSPAALLSGDPPFLSLIHPPDTEAALRLFALGGAGTLRMRHADGRVRCFKVRAKRRKGKPGEPALQLTLEDAASECWSPARLRAITSAPAVMECVDECVHFKDANHVIRQANRSYRMLFSDASGELRDLIGLTDYDLFPEEAADELFALENAVLAGSAMAHVVQETVDAEGRKEWLDIRKFPVCGADGASLGIFSITSPITEGVLSERALRATAESLKEAQRLAGLGSYVLEVETGKWVASEMLDAIFGIDAGYEHTVEGWRALLHPDDRERVSANIREEGIEKGLPVSIEYRVVRPSDRAVRWVHGVGQLEAGPDGGKNLFRGTIQDITERRLAEEALRESEALLKESQRIAGFGSYSVDMTTGMWEQSVGLDEILGIDDSYPHTIVGWMALIHAEDREEVINHFSDEVVDKDQIFDLEYRMFRWNDSAERWMHAVGRLERDEKGNPRRIRGIIQDITARRRADAALRESRELLQLFIEHAPAALAMFDREMHYIAVSRRWIEDYSLEGEEILGRSHYDVFPNIPETWKEAHRRGLAGEGVREVEDRFERTDGAVQWLRWELLPWRAQDGSIGGIILFAEDITRMKEHEEQLRRVAHYDLLTGLPNRVLLADRLTQAMALARRSGRQIAIACLDLDDFRGVNDRHGHSVGNALLAELARRMSSSLRKGDTIARLGGDELVAVLLDFDQAHDCQPVVEMLLRASAEPVQLGDLVLRVSASAGVTCYPQPDDVDADQLLRQADQAMYQAKLAGKGRCHFFDPTLDRSMRGRHQELERITQAIRQNELVLHFQPKVNMSTGALLGVEALVRWHHPERGLLPPGVFLPAILGTPAVIELGEWVLRAALRQLTQWRAEGLDIPVSVNLDATQLQQAGFADQLRGLLAEFPEIGASHLEIEILESSALEDMTHVSMVMRDCNRMGVTFSLDDFGTGYSSLSYLRRLPVQSIKIDQSFVRGMLRDPDDLTILEGVLGLATAFRRHPIAEGVETIEHGELLLRLGCQTGQGYGIARPMPGAAFPAWAAHWHPDPRWAVISSVDPLHWPVLYASVEHRAWVTAIEEFFNGQRATPPIVDHHLCRFGAWLDTEASAGRGTHAAFQSLDALHHRLHAFANGVVALRTNSKADIAKTGLRELHDLRDALLGALAEFVKQL